MNKTGGLDTTILIADDDPNICQLLEMLLSTCGYQLSFTRDGLETLNYLKTATPDLIILDVAMPHIDGIDICWRISRMNRFKSTPVVMLTALSDKETKHKLQKAGASLVLDKPLSGLNLREQIQDILKATQKKIHDTVTLPDCNAGIFKTAY